jgi:hypothetical protein
MRLRCLAVALTLLAAFASDSWGQSNQPPTKTGQQKATQQERGTENSPVVVKIIPAEKSKDDLAREDAKDKEKIAIDRQVASLTGDLAFYTKLLFGATAVLALITLGLVVASFRQVADATISIAAAVKSASAAEKSADAAKLNAQAAINAARAFLFISVEKDTIDYIVKMLASVRDDNPRDTPLLDATYTIKNYGKTFSLIKEISHQIIVRPTFPDEPPFEVIQPMPANNIILDSADKTHPIVCRAESIITVKQAKDICASKSTIWLYGYISYDDAFGFGREFRYKWYYNGSSGGLRVYSYKQIDTDKPH